MKKNIFIIGLFYLVSCSSIKTEEKIVQDFAKKGLLIRKDFKNTIYLMNKAELNVKALEYYEVAYSERNMPNGIRRKIDYSRDISIKWPIDSIEIKTLKENNKIDTLPYYWKKNNFKTLEIPIIEYKELKAKMKSEDFPTGTITYIFSKPIISLNGKFALLFYRDIGYFRKTDGGDGKAVLLEKVNKNWIINNSFSRSFD